MHFARFNYRLLTSTACAIALPLVTISPALAITDVRVARLYINNDSQCSLVNTSVGYVLATSWAADPSSAIAAHGSGSGVAVTSGTRLDASASYRVYCDGGTDTGSFSVMMDDNQETQELSASVRREGSPPVCISKSVSGNSEERVFTFTLTDCVAG